MFFSFKIPLGDLEGRESDSTFGYLHFDKRYPGDYAMCYFFLLPAE